MGQSEAVRTVVTQVAIQAAMVVVREAGAEHTLDTNAVSLEEACRHRQGRLSLRQPFFKWKATDKYVELLHF